MRIYLRIVPHESQKFTTLGYWQESGHHDGTADVVEIFISEMANWKYTVAILVHEILEWAWCRANGVSTEVADVFDEFYEEEYAAGRIAKTQEGGFDRRCPYRTGHVWGARAERFVIWFLGAKWKEYVKECDRVMGISDAVSGDKIR